MLAVDWAAFGVPGAFVAGMIVGGFAMVRVVRLVMEYIRRHE